MTPQPRPAVFVGSMLVIAACAVLASLGGVALLAPTVLTKLLGTGLILVPGLVGVFQYCGTFRQSHDAALLASTCLALLIVPALLLSVAVLIAGLTDPSDRPLLLTAGANLLGLALGGGWMMIANLQWASVLEEAEASRPTVPPSGLRVAAEVVGFLLIVAAVGTVTTMLETSSLVEVLLSVV